MGESSAVGPIPGLILWGFFDMHGNACGSGLRIAMGSYATGDNPGTDPFSAAASGSDRVLRGGWFLEATADSGRAPAIRLSRHSLTPWFP